MSEKTFDSSKGVPFSAYCRPSIHWKCQDALKVYSKRIKIGAAGFRLMTQYRQAYRELQEILGHAPSFHETCKRLHLSDGQKTTLCGAQHCDSGINKYQTGVFSSDFYWTRWKKN